MSRYEWQIALGVEATGHDAQLAREAVAGKTAAIDAIVRRVVNGI